jgi:hypothetical protein
MNITNEPDAFVAPGVAARLLGVTPRTITRWTEGLVEGVDYIRTPAGHRRISAALVRAWQEGKQVAA